MFARVSGSGKYRYLQLVENRRDSHRTVQRVLCTLGRVEELKASGRIDVLVHSLARYGQWVEDEGKYELSHLEKVGARALESLPTFQPERHAAFGNMGMMPSSSRSGSNETSCGEGGSKITEFSNHRKAVEVLRECPIYSDLDSNHIIELSRLATCRRLRAGQFIYVQDDPVKCCYLIVSGMAKTLKHFLSGKDLIAAIYGPGEILGIIALFLGNSYSSSAQAIIETEVLAIKRNDFASFLDKYPELSFKIAGRMLNVANRRHQAAIVRLGELAVERISYRLARVLFALFLQFGPVVPLTRREISEMAGTTTETVSRFVSRLRQEGIVESFRGRLVLLEQDKLRLLAQVHLPT